MDSVDAYIEIKIKIDRKRSRDDIKSGLCFV